CRQGRTSLLEEWLSPDGMELGASYIRRCFPHGDPFLHPHLESRSGKVVFAPRRSSPLAKFDFAAESRELVSRFDAKPSAIESSKAVVAGPRANSIKSMTWVLPGFSHVFYGGIHTILRFADYFHRAHGVTSEIVQLDCVPEPILRSRIANA